MRIAILTPVRLIGEGIGASLRACRCGFEPIIIHEVADLRALVGSKVAPQLVIVDATQSLSLEPIRAFHLDFPDLPLLAFGVREEEAEIVAHGTAGFVAYVSRRDGLAQVRGRIEDAIAGRLLCPPEITAGIMRGLFRRGLQGLEPHTAHLTHRETDVAELVSRGFANKEIARELDLSESTVKHHVHSILAKKHFGSRFQLVREAREDTRAGDTPRRALG
jgi:DNA-binding NarL/FixJ family response regulator